MVRKRCEERHGSFFNEDEDFGISVLEIALPILVNPGP